MADVTWLAAALGVEDCGFGCEGVESRAFGSC